MAAQHATNLKIDTRGRLLLAAPPGEVAELVWTQPHRGSFEVNPVTGAREWVESGELWATPRGVPLWRARVTAFDHRGGTLDVNLWVAAEVEPPSDLDDFEEVR